jgi:hypothetical protein
VLWSLFKGLSYCESPSAKLSQQPDDAINGRACVSAVSAQIVAGKSPG